MKLRNVERIGHRLQKWYVDGGKVGVHTVEDAEPVLEANKRLYNDAPKAFGKGTLHRVASFPATVVEAQAQKHNIPWKEFIAAKTDRARKAWNELLNDRDLRYFRTRPGRVDVRKK